MVMANQQNPQRKPQPAAAAPAPKIEKAVDTVAKAIDNSIDNDAPGKTDPHSIPATAAPTAVSKPAVAPTATPGLWEGIVADAVARCGVGVELEVYSFPQMWGSTALGFGGIGGAAMTKAQTTIVLPEDRSAAHVYFNSRFAYTIDARIGGLAEEISKIIDKRVAPSSPDVHKWGWAK
jgi:hypothetical protein